MSIHAANERRLPPVTRKEQQNVHVPGVETRTPIAGMVRNGNIELDRNPLPFTAGDAPVSFGGE
ncbi:hypothetical protein ACFQ1S_39300 [Kibdelosporangium lantanae]|uniref:Uncharacterized protein n=1 Tax=Kibdelosporangium lantanae TaxID=1497396 RepID=A0ABW3MNT4_9PSEU